MCCLLLEIIGIRLCYRIASCSVIDIQDLYLSKLGGGAAIDRNIAYILAKHARSKYLTIDGN
jgi:hypothetical protein